MRVRDGLAPSAAGTVVTGRVMATRDRGCAGSDGRSAGSRETSRRRQQPLESRVSKGCRLACAVTLPRQSSSHRACRPQKRRSQGQVVCGNRGTGPTRARGTAPARGENRPGARCRGAVPSRSDAEGVARSPFPALPLLVPVLSDEARRRSPRAAQARRSGQAARRVNDNSPERACGTSPAGGACLRDHRGVDAKGRDIDRTGHPALRLGIPAAERSLEQSATRRFVCTPLSPRRRARHT